MVRLILFCLFWTMSIYSYVLAGQDWNIAGVNLGDNIKNATACLQTKFLGWKIQTYDIKLQDVHDYILFTAAIESGNAEKSNSVKIYFTKFKPQTVMGITQALKYDITYIKNVEEMLIDRFGLWSKKVSHSYQTHTYYCWIGDKKRKIDSHSKYQLEAGVEWALGACELDKNFSGIFMIAANTAKDVSSGLDIRMYDLDAYHASLQEVERLKNKTREALERERIESMKRVKIEY